jgi:hypothetical protein
MHKKQSSHERTHDREEARSRLQSRIGLLNACGHISYWNVLVLKNTKDVLTAAGLLEDRCRVAPSALDVASKSLRAKPPLLHPSFAHHLMLHQNVLVDEF